QHKVGCLDDRNELLAETWPMVLVPLGGFRYISFNGSKLFDGVHRSGVHAAGRKTRRSNPLQTIGRQGIRPVGVTALPSERRSRRPKPLLRDSLRTTR